MIQKVFFSITKINNYRGDLTDISAETEAIPTPTCGLSLFNIGILTPYTNTHPTLPVNLVQAVTYAQCVVYAIGKHTSYVAGQSGADGYIRSLHSLCHRQTRIIRCQSIWRRLSHTLTALSMPQANTHHTLPVNLAQAVTHAHYAHTTGHTLSLRCHQQYLSKAVINANLLIDLSL